MADAPPQTIHETKRNTPRGAVLAMASEEIDRCRGLPASPALQLGQHIGERPIAMVRAGVGAPDRPTARGKPTVRPVGKALAEAEERRGISAPFGPSHFS